MTLDDMSARELKDYIRGLYVIPLQDFTPHDRENMTEAKEVLLSKGYETIFKSENHIVFRPKKLMNEVSA